MSSVLARRAHENETHSLTPECAREGLDNRDEESIIQLLRDAGIKLFERRVVYQLREGCRQYTVEILRDALDYADHGGRADIGMDDVRLAVRKKRKRIAAGPPGREDLISQAAEINRRPLPTVPNKFGIRLPPLKYQTTVANVQWEHETVQAEQATSVAEVDENAKLGHGGRNKKAKLHPKLTTRGPLLMKERSTQEAESKLKEEKKARRRLLQAQQAARGSQHPH